MFRDGPYAGDSVNVKWYPKREGLLDIGKYRPDWYLVLAGPRVPATSSRGARRPWVIDEVFLFRAEALIDELEQREVRIGIATGLRAADWEAARLGAGPGPRPPSPPLELTDRQRALLRLFRPN